MKARKLDREKIAQHLVHLKSAHWISESQLRWPGYLYHFTDIKNAISILVDNALFSRHELEKNRKLIVDIASPTIIQDTPDIWKDYVRLYFRPKTPTQYRNEGIRPKDKLELGGAHCPVPVVFIFRAIEVLEQANVKFSNGNLRVNGVQVDSSASFFESLPFEKIYHSRSLWGVTDSEKSTIIFHRNAEVIIPRSLGLESLSFIYCRSQAEFETLTNMLPYPLLKKWKKIIGVDNKQMFFFSEWSFIENVFLHSDKIIVSFNRSGVGHIFHAKLEIEEVASHEKYVWENKQYSVSDNLEFNITNIPNRESYIIKFYFDGNLAYQNIYLDEALLF